MTGALAMLVALVLDAVIGWPDGLYRRIGHPVTWLGRVIGGLEARLNHGTPRRRFVTGTLTSVIVIACITLPALAVLALLPAGWIGAVIMGGLAWPLVAVRSMYSHVADVAQPLAQSDLPQARHAVSMIVGRDPTQLDSPGVTRAALESLAENTSDGIVAPLFWGVVFGLPGIAAYKAINTLDSMIGHRNDRYEYFGKAAARLDDLVNLIPARLTGAFFAVTSARPWASVRQMIKDAGKHRSPNAGWPEAALAGALNVRLSGPRQYGDKRVEEPWVNQDAPDPTPPDLQRGLSLYVRAMVALGACLGILALS